MDCHRFERCGLTWGTAAGQIIAEQITGKSTSLDETLSPSRWAMGSLATMVAEQTTTAADYSERVLPACSFRSRIFAGRRGQGRGSRR